MALSNDELACVYAALILADDNVDIKGEKISTILKAANYEIEPYWPGLFASALEGVKVADLLKSVGSAPVAAAAAAPAPAAAAAGGEDKKAAAAKEAAKKPEKKEDSEGEGDDMVRANWSSWSDSNACAYSRALACSTKFTQSITDNKENYHRALISSMIVCLSFLIGNKKKMNR